MSSEAPGAETAERDPRDGGGLLGADTSPQQLDAFRDEKGKLPANVFQLARQQEDEPRRGPGRRKGSKNKRSTDLAQLIANNYPDPVQFMARLYAMPLDQVVELVKIADPGKDSKRGDIAIKALNVQLAAAKATAEYVHSKKPTEHKIDAGADAVIVMPGAMNGSFADLDEDTRRTGGIIATALQKGEITAQDLLGKSLVDGQLVDGEWSDVDDEPQGGDA